MSKTIIVDAAGGAALDAHPVGAVSTDMSFAACAMLSGVAVALPDEEFAALLALAPDLGAAPLERARPPVLFAH